MKQLSEFTTIEEAKDYSVEDAGIILNANDIGALLDKHPGTLGELESYEAHSETIRIFLTLFRSGGGRYDFRKNSSDTNNDGERLNNKLQDLVNNNLVSQQFADDVIAAANPKKKPYENITDVQFKASKNPPTWKPVDISSGNSQIVTPEGDLINNTNNGAFRFKIKVNENFNSHIKIRIFAKKAEETEFSLIDSYPIIINKDWESDIIYTHIFKRVVGLSGYRHFKFTYLEPYGGAVHSLEVEGVN